MSSLANPEIDPHGFIEMMGTAQREFIRFMRGNSHLFEWNGFAELEWAREFGLVDDNEKSPGLTRAGFSIADALEEESPTKEERS